MARASWRVPVGRSSAHNPLLRARRRICCPGSSVTVDSSELGADAPRRFAVAVSLYLCIRSYVLRVPYAFSHRITLVLSVCNVATYIFLYSQGPAPTWLIRRARSSLLVSLARAFGGSLRASRWQEPRASPFVIYNRTAQALHPSPQPRSHLVVSEGHGRDCRRAHQLDLGLAFLHSRGM